ncbi:MAG: TraX family protein [Clostridia bacterium]|nr:TraX family protein [Clostridia bacterium]
MSSFSLRLIALVLMCVDHAGLALFPSAGAFRCVGRLAFPLYCFLLAQGYRHTRDVRAYGRRLLLAAILSEIPFDLLIFGRVACAVEQNVLFSLLLGLLALWAADTLGGRPLYALLAASTLALVAMAARVSYGWLGIALCLIFGFSAGRKQLLGAAAALLLYTLGLLFSGVARSWVLVSLCALLSLPLLALYNGKRGPRAPLITLLFYAAYPVHLLALAALRAMRLVPPYFL